MGYTHYWKNAKKLDDKAWTNFIKEVKQVYKSLPNEIDGEPLRLNGCYKYKTPTFSQTRVYFNGEGTLYRVQKSEIINGKKHKFWNTEVSDLGHDTFSIQKKGTSSYTFCKTARKPYDLMVTATLVLYAKHFGVINTNISSDGDLSEWVDGIKLVRDTVGVGNLSTVLYTTTDDGGRRAYLCWKFSDEKSRKRPIIADNIVTTRRISLDDVENAEFEEESILEESETILAKRRKKA